ncbi:MID1 [Branchiostoma lanceolatum]|uniref:MID1 protein n=1 Tax=Branchiostoma lanceolatum TaxID=7740 RepID=A0A8K0A0E9_BRALA|nr:MID1 [Branchiostoma lanceolatum]
MDCDSGMASWDHHPSDGNSEDLKQNLRQSEEAREELARQLEEETRLKDLFQARVSQLESKLQDHEKRLRSLESKMATLPEEPQPQQVVDVTEDLVGQGQGEYEDSQGSDIREVKAGESSKFGLDPATIHGKLETQVDMDKGKILIKYNGDQEVVNTVGRFVGKSHTALGDVLISGGRMYWEVDVRKSNHYRTGVVSKTVKRDKWIGDTKKSWCIRNNDGEVSARHNYVDSGLRLVRNPPVIGVLLDYDSAKVQFFDADSGKHLQTYDVDVTEPLRPAFQVNEGCVVVNSAVFPAKMEELLSAMDAAGFFNDKRLAALSKSIGKEWRQVASCLGLEKVQLDKLEINHPRDHSRQVLEGLSAWRLTMKDDGEMLAKLMASLQECNRSDLAEKIQEEHGQHGQTEESDNPS